MKATICEKCQETVQYTTNKPKLCKSCRAEKEERFSARRKNASKPFRSKKEGLMQKLLNDILPDDDYIDNGYYSWLISPKGAPLQLDRFYPELNIAFELI